MRERLGKSATLTSVNLQPVLLRANNADIQTMAEVVDGHYFALSGMTPRLGRGLSAGDDTAERPAGRGDRRTIVARSLRRVPGRAGRIDCAQRRSPTPSSAWRARSGRAAFSAPASTRGCPLAHGDPLLNRGWRTDVTTAGGRPSRSRRQALRKSTPVSPLPARTSPTLSGSVARAPPADGTGHCARRRAAGDGHEARRDSRGICRPDPRRRRSECGRPAAGPRRGGSRHVAIHLSLGSGRGAVARRLLIEGGRARDRRRGPRAGDVCLGAHLVRGNHRVANAGPSA